MIGLEGGQGMIKAVIFDVDGVLVDSEPRYASLRQEYLASYGVAVSWEQMARFAGFRFTATMEALRSGIPEDIYQRILEDFVPWDLDYPSLLRPEVCQVMEQLKGAGMKIGIASNSMPDKIACLLRACGLERYVDAACSGAQVGRPKPAPDVYLETARRLGLPCQLCAAVEDSDAGLRAAADAGCTVFCLVDQRFPFRQDTADIWIRQLAELPQAVERLRRTPGGLPPAPDAPQSNCGGNTT